MNEITLPEENKKGMTALEQAQALVIVTATDYTAADNFCVGLKGLEKEVDEAYDENISAAFKAHRGLVAKKNKYAEPIIEARKVIKSKMGAWQTEQESKRKAEEARLQAEAQKRAEDEALAAAAEAQKNGDKAEAEAIIAAPIVAPIVVLPSFAPKSKTTIQTRWDFRIVNAALIPREYLSPDTVKIGGVIRATKGSISIPGVEAFEKKV